MRFNLHWAIPDEGRCESSSSLKKQCLKHAVFASVLFSLFILSGCAGTRNVGVSILDRFVESSNEQSKEKSAQQKQSGSEAVPRDAPAESLESEKVTLAAYQEYSDGHLGEPISQPNPNNEIVDTQMMNAQPITPATHTPPPALAISNAPQTPVTYSFSQGAHPSPMANVVRAQGDQFRQHQRTATEILIEMRAENEKINGLLRTQNLAYSDLLDELKREQAGHQRTMAKLDRSEAVENQLRRLSADLQVKVDRLEKEKIEIGRQADAELKKIEASLDAVLLESIARARKTSRTKN